MRPIVRTDIDQDWAHAGIVQAGDFVFVSYCVGNV
ncbi:MAG TPA: RidA family protein, partial [Firmicutes bacterium]|nr:RidA family protein [Bacillota bacterium]